MGVRLLRDVPFLEAARPAVASHHEHWDGSGYPLGLEGESIPLIGRIIAVADVFEALTADRAYRERLECAEALQEIVRRAGAQFDPAVVVAMVEVVKHVGD